jgi:hypothetical protein
MEKLLAETATLPSTVLEDLQSETGADQRYPWRFVFTSTLWGLKPIVTAIKGTRGVDVQVMDVTSGQFDPESVITSDDLLRSMRECYDAGGSWIFTGLSEVLRFRRNEDFEALVRAISEWENHGDDRRRRRFYIPLAGLHERFQQLVWNRAQREGRGLWPASWVVQEQTGPTLQVLLLGHPIDVTTSPTVASYAKFMSLWNGLPVQSVIVTSATVAALYDMAPKDVFPDAAVSITRLPGYAEYLGTVLGVSVPVQFRNQDAASWRQFAEDMQSAEEPRLHNVLCKRFNVARPSLADALSHWTGSASGEYSRWLLRTGVCSLYPDSHLAQCFGRLDGLDTTALTLDLLSGVIRHKEERTPGWLTERRMHLRVLSGDSGQVVDLPDDLQQLLTDLPPTEQLALLTDTTAWERCQFIRLFADSVIPRDMWFKAVQDSFPVLCDYLEPYRHDGLPEDLSWVNGYFNDYRESRLLDQPSDVLKDDLAHVNSGEESFYKWYYAARNHGAANALSSQGTQALMVDGMGWEWAPFIVRRLRRLGLVATNLVPTAACLPTTTKFNRFDPRVTVTHDSLDAVAHRATYQHPQTLLEELELMRKLVDQQLAKPGTVVLSDHGLTAFSRSVAGISKYQMEDIEHEGRCAWLKTQEKTCPDFLVREVPPAPGLPSGRVALALGYTPLGSMGTHLAHGGATPEEVLVPSFVVRMREGQQRYAITRIIDENSSTASRRVVFEVEPEPIAAPKVTVAKKETTVTHLASGKWAVWLPKDLVGDVIVDIQVETTTVTWNVPVKAGMVEKELFE